MASLAGHLGVTIGNAPCGIGGSAVGLPMSALRVLDPHPDALRQTRVGIQSSGRRFLSAATRRSTETHSTLSI